MLTSTTRSYIGKGPIYLKRKGAAAGRLPIGNASKLELSIAEEKKPLKDYVNAGGGNKDLVSRISDVSGSITVHDLSPANLAIALRGTSASVAASSVTDESHTAYHGALVAFNDLPDPDQPIVVTNEAATVTYVKDTDYTVTRAGIVILASGTIADASTIKVDYTKNPAVVVQALTESGLEYELVFDGLNEADSGNPVIVSLHRIKFGPASGLGLIGDEFAGLEMSLEVLSDDTVTGTGLSRHMKVTMAA